MVGDFRVLRIGVYIIPFLTSFIVNTLTLSTSIFEHYEPPADDNIRHNVNIYILS